jgi:hypothetical protein
MLTPFRIKHLDILLFKLIEVQERPLQAVPLPLHDRSYQETRMNKTP